VADPLFASDDDANTPLTPDECDGLIPSHVTLRHELNEAEPATRTAYVAALRAADKNDYEPLLRFCRS
jgi:hypothetical protein